MHKLDKYCRRFTNDFIESDRSRYYNINNHILRISDQIGMSSSGLFSIVIKGNHYILHHPNSGSVEILDYNEVKAFVKIFAKFPMGQMSMLSQWDINKKESLRKEAVVLKEDWNVSLFGIPVRYYTEGEKRVLQQTIKQARVRETNNIVKK